MTTTMGVKIDEEIRSRLKTLGEARKRSTHWIMKEAIVRYLEQEEEIERRNLEANQAWKDYMETGVHVTNENMTDWLDSWGTDKEIKCPSITNPN
jgi:predicted transcriptional regulator